MLHVYRDVEATPEYLAQVRAEVSRLKALPKSQSCPLALEFLKGHEASVATEISDRDMGLCWVTFNWPSSITGRSGFSRKYLRVPKREITRLKLTDELYGFVRVSLDNKYYYFAISDMSQFYNARQVEGRPVGRLPEITIDGKAPVHAMVNLDDLRDGSVKLVRGEIVYVSKRR